MWFVLSVLTQVYIFFAQSEPFNGDGAAQISGRLGGTLKRVKETLIIDEAEIYSQCWKILKLFMGFVREL
jgi:hypothetical protein